MKYLYFLTMPSVNEPKVELTQVFARTSRGQSEALDPSSALTPMLRHLLILLDGRAPLSDLQTYYPHKDISVAALLLWHHGYAQPVLTQEKPGFFRKMLWGKSADTVAPQVNSEFFVDSLQSVFPGTQGGDVKPRFSESGKYWFSQGGLALSKEAAAKLRDHLHIDSISSEEIEHFDLPIDDSPKKLSKPPKRS
jgi:hypothetical protein